MGLRDLRISFVRMRVHEIRETLHGCLKVGYEFGVGCGIFCT